MMYHLFNRPEVFTEEVIICRKDRRGIGTELDPHREIVTVYTKSGEYIAEHDDLRGIYTRENMIDFITWFSEKRGSSKATIEDIEAWEKYHK